MNTNNDCNQLSQNSNTTLDADSEFHMAFGWLAALSISIASAALAIIT